MILANRPGVLVVAVLADLVAKSLALACSVGLVVTGFALARADAGIAPLANRDFVYLMVLPFLLFKATITACGMMHFPGWPLALALSLPSAFARSCDIRIAAFGAVVFSVLVQGPSMPLWLPKLRGN